MSITVVMPAYNAEKYIRESVESVLAQTIENVELIVINDCSSDKTLTILESYSDPRLKVINNSENLGQSRSRNKGIALAKNEYIAFLDSDDIYLTSTALEKWYYFAKKHDSDICRTNHKITDSDSNIVRKPVTYFTGKTIINKKLCDHVAFLNNGSCWNLLYRRQFLVSNSVYFSEFLRQREDRIFFTEALIKAESISAMNSTFIGYRVHSESTMRNTDSKQVAMFTKHMEMLKPILENQSKEIRFHTELRYLNVFYTYWIRELKDDSYINDNKTIFSDFVAALKQLLLDGTILEDESTLYRGSGGKLNVVNLQILKYLILYCSIFDVHYFLKLGKIQYKTFRSLSLVKDIYFDKETYNEIQRVVDFNEESPSKFKPKIILHIGMTKTGSSSLQKIMEYYRFELLEGHSVYYPITALENGRGDRKNRTSGHALLANNIIKNKSFQFDNLEKELYSLSTKPDTVFISIENILSSRYWGNGDTIKKIVDKLSRISDDIHIVGFFREQTSWLKSMYIEMIESPHIKYCNSFQTFIHEQDQQGITDYNLTFERLKETGCKITYLPYESTFKKGGTVNVMFDILGVDATKFNDITKNHPELSNRSLSDKLAIVKRKLNGCDIDNVEGVINLLTVSQEKPASFDYLTRNDKRELFERYRSKNVGLFDELGFAIESNYENVAFNPKLNVNKTSFPLSISVLNSVVDKLIASKRNKKVTSKQKTIKYPSTNVQGYHKLLYIASFLSKGGSFKQLVELFFLRTTESIDTSYYKQKNSFAPSKYFDCYSHYVLNKGEGLFVNKEFTNAKYKNQSGGFSPLYNYFRNY